MQNCSNIVTNGTQVCSISYLFLWESFCYIVFAERTVSTHVTTTIIIIIVLNTSPKFANWRSHNNWNNVGIKFLLILLTLWERTENGMTKRMTMENYNRKTNSFHSHTVISVIWKRDKFCIITWNKKRHLNQPCDIFT